MQKRRLALALLVLLLFSTLVACGGGDGDDDESGGDDPQPTVVDPAPDQVVVTEGGPRATLPPSVELVTGEDLDNDGATSSVRFFHGIEDVQRLSVAINGQIVFRNVASTVATLPILRAPGTYDIEVISVVPGQVRTGDETIYFSGEIDITEEDRLILMLVGTAEDNELLIFDEDLSPMLPDETRVRFVNLLNRDAPLRVEFEGDVLADELRTQVASSNLLLEPGAYRFDVLDGDALVTSASLQLETGMLNTVIIVRGDNGDPQLRAIENSTPPQARVRFTHAAPDTPPLQVWLEGELKLESIAFGETTAFEVLPAQRFSVDVYRGGAAVTVDDDTVPAQSTEFVLPEFESAEVVIYGPDTNLNVTAFPLDTTPVPTNTSRVTFINVAFDQPPLSMYYATRDDPFVDLAYNRSSTVNLPPAETRIFFGVEAELSEQGPTEEPDTSLQFAEGVAYSYVIVGRSMGTTIFNSIPFVEITRQTSQDTSVGATVQQPSIQVLNGWDQIVQVNVGETRVALGLEPGNISEPVQIQPTELLVELLNPQGQLLFEQLFTFNNEEENTYTLYISRAEAGVVLTTLPNSIATVAPNVTQVRVIHLHPDFDRLSVSLEEVVAPVLDDDVTPEAQETIEESVQLLYRSGSRWIQVPAQEYELAIADPVAREFIFNETYDFDGAAAYDILLQQGTAGEIIVTVYPRDFQ
jgi:hypothetical protein